MNDSLMSEPGDHGGGADFEEEEEEEEEEERILGPLGGAGLLALVTEVLCSCAGAAGFIAMIWLGIDCLVAGSEAKAAAAELARAADDGSRYPPARVASCGPLGYSSGGILMLALGWLPCTCCFLRSLARRVRRKRVRVMPLPVAGSIGLDVCFAKKDGTVVGPLPLFEAATRVLRRGIIGDNPIWVAADETSASEIPATAQPLSTYLNMNEVWIHCQRDYDDHRRIDGDVAGWGGPRQQIFEDLRRVLFRNAKVTTPVVLNVYDWSGRKAIVAMNKWACCGCGGGGVMGAFHAGVEVLGREYSFGWNDEGSTGVFWVEPKGAEALFGHRFRQRIVLGTVTVTMDELDEIVAQLEIEWMGYMYDMWHKNCNHFCDALGERLSAKSTDGVELARIPIWVNRLLGSTAVFWDKAVWSQRLYDGATNRQLKKQRREAFGDEECAPPRGDPQSAVAALGPSLPMDAAPVDAGGDGGQLQRLMRMDPRTMSPDQLRELIESCGLTHADCVAKSQLQERAREALDYHRGGGAGSNTATDAAVAADDDQAPDPPAWSPVEPSELSALPAAVAAPPGRLPPVTPPPGRTTSSVDGTPGDSHGEAEV
jgi:hypothetical protein